MNGNLNLCKCSNDQSPISLSLWMHQHFTSNFPSIFLLFLFSNFIYLVVRLLFLTVPPLIKMTKKNWTRNSHHHRICEYSKKKKKIFPDEMSVFGWFPHAFLNITLVELQGSLFRRLTRGFGDVQNTIFGLGARALKHLCLYINSIPSPFLTTFVFYDETQPQASKCHYAYMNWISYFYLFLAPYFITRLCDTLFHLSKLYSFFFLHFIFRFRCVKHAGIHHNDITSLEILSVNIHIFYCFGPSKQWHFNDWIKRYRPRLKSLHIKYDMH